MEHIYWVGIKESEIRSCRGLFEGSVTFIGSGKNGNISYSASNDSIINYNIDSMALDNFIRESLHQIIDKVPNVSFLCYTPSYIYSLEDTEINSHMICQSERETLQLLRNKMSTRFWIRKEVPVLPTTILIGCECHYEYLCRMFPATKHFTIQGCTGSGGNDTFVMSKKNADKIVNCLKNNRLYLVSPYQIQSYSINVHVFFDMDNYVITPGSIQIVEPDENKLIYRGADFIAYEQLPQNILSQINNYVKKIAAKIKYMNYIGILGIDFLIVGEKIYFLEINPRFQSSTPLLNLALQRMGFPTIQELLVQKFLKNKSIDIGYLENINVSFASYIIDFKTGIHDYESYLEFARNTEEITELLLDGYYTNIPCEDGSSIFSITASSNMVSVTSEGTLNCYDNIHPPLKTLDFSDEISYRKWLKFSLMNQGVQFSAKVLSEFKNFQKGVYSSIDLYLSNTFIINCPCKNPFSSMSPFLIDTIDNELYLLYGQNVITPVRIKEKEKYCDKSTKAGVDFSVISFLATDRLRIHHSPYCEFKRRNLGCNFCDVPGQGLPFEWQDIKEVIDWHLSNSDFRHFLIGGASGNWSEEVFQILSIVNYIRLKCDKPIYVMTLPPKDDSKLLDYYNAGVTEVAFNIEIYDRKLARQIMPGKGRIPLEQYKETLIKSVELWGNTGNVRSLLIYGLDSDENFFAGIEWLASHGIQPIISPFRALKGTRLENYVPPSSERLITVYEKSTVICKKYGLNLGPDCIYCQNNTLSFSP